MGMGPLGASGRVRSNQYLPLPETAGFRVTVAPFVDDNHVKRRTPAPRHRSSTRSATIGRISDLRRSSDFDTVWIECQALPLTAIALGHSRFQSGVTLIVDYDDVFFFHRYDQHRLSLLRVTLGDKTTELALNGSKRC